VKTLVLAFVTLGTLASGPVSAQLFQNGPYYANPSWDQQIPAAQRFIVLSNWNNDAVLDRETGLVWERSPVSAVRIGWFDAVAGCDGLNVANRLSWRLPSLQELTSLIDPTQSNPALPAGSPFQGIASFLGSVYWTAATAETDPNAAKAVDFSNGSITQIAKLQLVPLQGARFWCVRSGSSVSNPPY
jgi:Protein of unknown function (DUF1566)